MSEVGRPISYASPEEWGAFLLPLVATTANAPAKADYPDHCRAIAFALDRVPSSLLNPVRQREAMRRFQFFPRPAQLWEWLAPEVEAFHRYKPPLVIGHEQPELPPQPRSEEQIAAVRATVQAFMASRRADLLDREVRAGPDDPAYISDGQILAVLEAQLKAGATALKPRVEYLRRKLAGSHPPPNEAGPSSTPTGAANGMSGGKASAGPAAGAAAPDGARAAAAADRNPHQV